MISTEVQTQTQDLGGHQDRAVPPSDYRNLHILHQAKEDLKKDNTQEAKKVPEKPRNAFDTHLAAKGVYETLNSNLAPQVAQEITIDTLAKNWSGFAWEYGLKSKLGFTPYPHAYYQLGNKVFCEEDLLTGVSFEDRLDLSERGGLVAEASLQMMERFKASRVGAKFLAGSPLSDPGEGFSDYSFLYFCKVVDSPEGKKLETYDFLNDLSREQFIELFNQAGKCQTLAASASMREVMTTFPEVNFTDLSEIWKVMTEIKPDGTIFGKEIDEILASNNMALLMKAKQRSRVEAERLFQEITSGMSLDLLQDQIGERLKNCVEELLGSDFDIALFLSSIEGSCGTVSINLPSWCEFNSITGEITCKHCRKGLTRSQVNSHRCIC